MYVLVVGCTKRQIINCCNPTGKWVNQGMLHACFLKKCHYVGNWCSGKNYFEICVEQCNVNPGICIIIFSLNLFMWNEHILKKNIFF